MEDGINPDRKKQSQSFLWLQEIDQILVVGMKYGPRGTQEAVKKVRQLTPELVPAQVWHRMRHLRDKERGKDKDKDRERDKASLNHAESPSPILLDTSAIIDAYLERNRLVQRAG